MAEAKLTTLWPSFLESSQLMASMAASVAPPYGRKSLIRQNGTFLQMRVFTAGVTEPRGVIVIGGGPAGAAAAIEISRGGGHATVLERDAIPRDKVCGEFLSEGAIDDLAARGVSVQLLGAARISRMRFISGRTVAEAEIPFRAAALSRARLDAALLDRANAAGADVRRGIRVQSYTTSSDATSVELDGGATKLTGRSVIVATGKAGFAGLRRHTSWRGRREMIA